MPAYREEQNLASTVADFLRVSESIGVPHCVVVVNDGSPDGTADVAERLAAQYRGRVLVVHHEVNRGYGAAVSTGIRTALERLGHRWLFLTDSDGQFKAAQLPAFLAEARRERADVVVGYRPTRADPWYRRANAFLWTTASRVLLRVGVRDVDCAYKLIDRSHMHGIVLKGEAATISPELIAKLRLRNARIIERPVEHFPRQHGEQTGAKLSVVMRSLVGLLALSLQIAGQRTPGRLLHRLLHPKDSALAVTTLAATSASVATEVERPGSGV
jgi:glycosyltransferase involved in cell wall biosynthesis